MNGASIGRQIVYPDRTDTESPGVVNIGMASGGTDEQDVTGGTAWAPGKCHERR